MTERLSPRGGRHPRRLDDRRPRRRSPSPSARSAPSWPQWLSLAAIALAGIAADQLTKSIVTSQLDARRRQVHVVGAVLDPPRAELGHRVRALRERDVARHPADRARRRLDALLLRALRLAASGPARRARARDRRQRLESARPRAARLRHGLPRLQLLAGVQPRRQLHRRRRAAPAAGARGRRSASRAGRQRMRDTARVPDEAAGERLDRFLASLPEIGSRAVAERLLEAGACSSTARRAAKSHKLAGGEEVEFEPPAREPSRARARGDGPAIPYEDEHLLVVDKPAGLVVHPAPGHADRHARARPARTRHRGRRRPERPGIVHRLDRDTSGLLVVARSGRRTASAGARAEPRAERHYTALVVGRPRSRQRHDRGADRARPPRPAAALARHRHAARRDHALRGARSCWRVMRSST